MATKKTRTRSLRTPWDTILGTKSHVRALRVLEETRESMAVRELARRAGEHLRSVQLAVNRLVRAGVIERVGTGSLQQVRLNAKHPLTTPLQQLFEAERIRFDRLVSELKALAQKCANRASAVWLIEDVPTEDDPIEVGLIATSASVDEIADTLRESVLQLVRREYVNVEVQGWTRPDLEALEWSPMAAPNQLILLWGVLPEEFADRAGLGNRSHAAVDEALLERAERVVIAIRQRPELVRKALRELQKRLETASPHTAKTLREWQDVLENMSIPQLSRWLVSPGERATRLRQSMPTALLEAADGIPGSKPDRS
jgi:predicted transcriptional regulator